MKTENKPAARSRLTTVIDRTILSSRVRIEGALSFQAVVPGSFVLRATAAGWVEGSFFASDRVWAHMSGYFKTVDWAVWRRVSRFFQGYIKGMGKGITKCVPYSCTLERLASTGRSFANRKHGSADSREGLMKTKTAPSVTSFTAKKSAVSSSANNVRIFSAFCFRLSDPTFKML